jgi:hypothetical protein
MMNMRHSRRIPYSVCLALLVITAACRGDRGTGTAGTAGTTAVRVTDVTLGRSVGGDKAITDRTDTFRPNDTIYASVATEGSANSARSWTTRLARSRRTTASEPSSTSRSPAAGQPGNTK